MKYNFKPMMVFALFSILLVPITTQVTAKDNLPGYMKPFGIVLGQPIDPNINYERLDDNKAKEYWSGAEATDDAVDILWLDRVSPPTPNPLFKNNSWFLDGYSNDSGTWNGYIVTVTRQTKTVISVRAKFYNLGDSPWGGNSTIKSCDRIKQVNQYFRTTYTDLNSIEVFDKVLSDGEHQFRWSYQSSAHSGAGLQIACSEGNRNGERKVEASMSFYLDNDAIKQLRDRESLAEENSGF